MGAKLFVPNWDHAAACKLRLGLIKGLGVRIGNGDSWLDRFLPPFVRFVGIGSPAHIVCRTALSLTGRAQRPASGKVSPRDKVCWAVLAPICSGNGRVNARSAPATASSLVATVPRAPPSSSVSYSPNPDRAASAFRDARIYAQYLMSGAYLNWSSSRDSALVHTRHCDVQKSTVSRTAMTTRSCYLVCATNCPLPSMLPTSHLGADNGLTASSVEPLG